MKKICLTLILLSFVGAAGCTYGALTNDYGKSYTMAKQGQILNPQASKNLQPVTGLSGKAAAAGEEKYIQSFSATSNGKATKGVAMPVIPAGSAGTGQDVYGK